MFQGRLYAGRLFAGRLFRSVEGGYLPAEVQAGRSPALRLIPARRADAFVRPERVALAFGPVLAEAFARPVERRGAEVEVLPLSPVSAGFARVTAYGAAETTVRRFRFDCRFGRIAAQAAGSADVLGARGRTQFGAVESTAAASPRVSGARLSSQCGVTTAEGIRGVSDEELILIYRRLRSRRNMLLTRKQSAIYTP